MKTHELKIWPSYFTAILNERKTFEIRQNDREFQVGDYLNLREYDPEKDEYTGRACDRFICYITEWEQKPGFCVLGISSARPKFICQECSEETSGHMRYADQDICKGCGNCA